jgi:hypothetical protein
MTFIIAEYPKIWNLEMKRFLFWISADFILHKDGTKIDIDIELTFQNKKKIINILHLLINQRNSYTKDKMGSCQKYGVVVNSRKY